MKRSKFSTTLGVAAALWPLVTHAQEPKKIPHLCFLTFDPGTLQSSPRFDVFFNSLRDLGYVDGQTIVIHYLSADEKDDRFPALASECLRAKADIIAVRTTPAALRPRRGQPARAGRNRIAKRNHDNWNPRRKHSPSIKSHRLQ